MNSTKFLIVYEAQKKLTPSLFVAFKPNFYNHSSFLNVYNLNKLSSIANTNEPYNHKMPLFAEFWEY